MASQISTYLRPILLNYALAGGSFTPPPTIYLALHTAAPGGSGGSEVTGGSYLRQVVAFSTATGDTVDNVSLADFDGMPGCTVVGVSLWDAPTGGNCLWTADATPVVVIVGNTLRMPAALLHVKLD